MKAVARLAAGRDPVTPNEWQEAVDWADLLLMLESARAYGLVTGGPTIAVDRCADVLARGAAQGITPRPGHVDACLAALARDQEAR